MLIQVDAHASIGAYTDPTAWQNNTLRYSPPKDFPRFLAKTVGRAKIMRSFITLDEYWDYRTDKFYPDYEIGVKRYPDEALHYIYDWKMIVPAPSGTRFVDYLTSHAQEADELLLNVRRLEREVLDGILPIEDYERVFEKAVSYCKQLAPNIRYIECCNEVDLDTFGNLTAEEYLILYRVGHRVVRRLNARHHYEIPLEIGGWSVAKPYQNWKLWERFLELLAAEDPSGMEGKKIDFYSQHYYNQQTYENLLRDGNDPEALALPAPDRIKLLYRRHHALLARLGLPEGPFFLNELGYTRTTGVLTDALRNACGLISFFIAAADRELRGLYLFPWCSFHNPELQISFTQFLLREDGSYAATPNGIAILLLHRMQGEQLAVTVEACDALDRPYRAQAVRDGDRYYVTCANTSPDADGFDLELAGMADGSYRVRRYLCDSTHNNCVTGEGNGVLTVTAEETVTVENGCLSLHADAEGYAFIQFEIEKQ